MRQKKEDGKSKSSSSKSKSLTIPTILLMILMTFQLIFSTITLYKDWIWIWIWIWGDRSGDRCGWFNIAIISTVCVWETERQHWWYWSWLSEPQFNISISVPSWTSQLTLLQLTNTSFYFISTHQPIRAQSLVTWVSINQSEASNSIEWSIFISLSLISYTFLPSNSWVTSI